MNSICRIRDYETPLDSLELKEGYLRKDKANRDRGSEGGKKVQNGGEKPS
jgi:hypothetical protein